jgi:2,3-dihydroxybenzoate decarboxylase
MKIIALEEHFIMPKEEQNLPPGAHRGNDREKLLGFDVVAELLNLGDTRLAAMDSAGIDVQVLSHNQPGCQALEPDAAIPMAREVNDLLFEAIKAHPDRFAGLAALPTADPAAAVKELDRAVTRLGFKGAMINGHTRGTFIDDKKFWCIFECAQALRVPVYLHPSKPHPAVMQAYFAGYDELALAAWGFGIDTGAHFLRLVFAGVFDAFPALTFILGHLGEGLPFMLHRINDQTQLAAARLPLQRDGTRRGQCAVFGRLAVRIKCSGSGFPQAAATRLARHGKSRASQCRTRSPSLTVDRAAEELTEPTLGRLPRRNPCGQKIETVEKTVSWPLPA